ncbi:hypothetical protein C8046_05265 [Serinibacter arcticus]|uniref:Uncharacterized protein n=1 Tax=Serinibacter arcticus TaxID=1655435 RepID=A0A2U1ZTA5_9MICO|nr:hypothetical protein [Serinibacter arcticus]PWD50163.1 hypothetical protein C8046_05265 [Serinibacter arcticus]
MLAFGVFRYVSTFSEGFPLSGLLVGVGAAGQSYGALVQSRLGGLPDVDREAGDVTRAARPALVVGFAVAGALIAIEAVAGS